MFIYSNATGSHICGGLEDMRKADGYATNYANRIIVDEEGELVGVSGGSMDLVKSMGLIANLKKQAAEEVLRKSQQSAQLKKSFKQAKPLHRTRTQQIAASMDNKAGFTKLLAELDGMRSAQKLMKSRSW